MWCQVMACTEEIWVLMVMCDQLRTYQAVRLIRIWHPNFHTSGTTASSSALMFASTWPSTYHNSRSEAISSWITLTWFSQEEVKMPITNFTSKPSGSCTGRGVGVLSNMSSSWQFKKESRIPEKIMQNGNAASKTIKIQGYIDHWIITSCIWIDIHDLNWNESAQLTPVWYTTYLL